MSGKVGDLEKFPTFCVLSTLDINQKNTMIWFLISRKSQNHHKLKLNTLI